MGNFYQSGRFDKKTRFVESQNNHENEINKLNELLRNPTKFNTDNESKAKSYFKKLPHKEAALQALDFLKPKKITYSKIPINSYLKQKLQNKSEFLKRKPITKEEYFKNNILFLNYFISKTLLYENQSNITMSSTLFSSPSYFLSISNSLNENFSINVIKNMAFFMEEKLKIENDDFYFKNKNFLFKLIKEIENRDKLGIKNNIENENNKEVNEYENLKFNENHNKNVKSENENVNLVHNDNNHNNINENEKQLNEKGVHNDMNKDKFQKQATINSKLNHFVNDHDQNANKSIYNSSREKKMNNLSTKNISNMKSKKELSTFLKKSDGKISKSNSKTNINNNKFKNMKNIGRKSEKIILNEKESIKNNKDKNYKVLRGKNYYDFLEGKNNIKSKQFNNISKKTIKKITNTNLFTKIPGISNNNLQECINDNDRGEYIDKNKINLKEVITNMNLKEFKRIPKNKIENHFNYELNLPSSEYIKQLIYIKNEIWNKNDINFENDFIDCEKNKNLFFTKNSSFVNDKKDVKSESGVSVFNNDFKNQNEILEKLKNENIFLFK